MNSFKRVNEFLVKLEFNSIGLVLLSRSVLSSLKLEAKHNCKFFERL